MVADLTAQKMTGVDGQPMDRTRTLALGTFGVFYYGFPAKALYLMYDRVLGPRMPMMTMLVDVFIHTPIILIPCFYYLTGAIKGGRPLVRPRADTASARHAPTNAAPTSAPTRQHSRRCTRLPHGFAAAIFGAVRHAALRTGSAAANCIAGRSTGARGEGVVKGGYAKNTHDAITPTHS